MANHKSAVKAHRRSLERRDRNRQYRSRMRRALRSMRTAMDAATASDGGGSTVALREQFRSTVSLIDRLAGKGIIHVNTASRYKARLNKRLVAI
ncbi:MAG: 30S ribosomal protein S20 [Acidobacteria bacterium]|nr:30S ribosomal protein S20 [Acidobacteriota bacterium]